MTADTTPKRALHTFVRQDSYDTLQAFADENGTSITGLVQAMLDDLQEELEAAGTADIRQLLVRQARKIDADRRRR